MHTIPTRLQFGLICELKSPGICHTRHSWVVNSLYAVRPLLLARVAASLVKLSVWQCCGGALTTVHGRCKITPPNVIFGFDTFYGVIFMCTFCSKF